MISLLIAIQSTQILLMRCKEDSSADLSNGPAAADEIGMVSVDVRMLTVDQIADHALCWRGAATDKLLHCRDKM